MAAKPGTVATHRACAWSRLVGALCPGNWHRYQSCQPELWKHTALHRSTAGLRTAAWQYFVSVEVATGMIFHSDGFSEAPILTNKQYASPSIFTPENLLREARRQKGLPEGRVPAI